MLNHQSSKTIKVQKPSKFIFSNTLQIKIVQHVEFNTFLKFFSFLYRIWKWNVQWNSAQSWLTKIHKLFHMTSRKQTVQGECFYEWQLNSPGCEDRSEWQCRKTRLQWLTDVAFHPTHQKGYQSKLLFFHLKGSRFSSWGLLHRNDQRLPSWASHDRLQYDCSCSDTPSWLVWI